MATDTQDPPMTQADREANADFDPATGAATNGAIGPFPGEVEDEKVRSMEEIEREAAEQPDAGVGEEEDGQLFVVENEKRVSLSTLYGRNTPVEVEFKLSGKSIKGGPGTGLIAFSDPDLMLVVPARAGKVEVEPTYNPDGTVKKVVLRPHIKVVTVYDARSEAGQVALRGE